MRWRALKVGHSAPLSTETMMSFIMPRHQWASTASKDEYSEKKSRSEMPRFWQSLKMETGGRPSDFSSWR